MEIDKNELIMKAPKERYEQQLDDIRWKFKADNIRIRDKHQCRLCKDKKTQLDVHHIRYISGREVWDYDDGDLITLCHKCHEELHKRQNLEKLVPGSYYYDKALKGVGIVEYIQSDGVWFHACWTDDKHWQVDGHGRLYAESISYAENIREASPSEIKEFWKNVETYYNIDDIISYFGKHLKYLFPTDHPIRKKARNCFKEALEIYKKQKRFIQETFNFILLVSDENYALLEDNRNVYYPYDWTAYELPRNYFKIAPVEDVKKRAIRLLFRQIEFNDMDFSSYRAATIDELQEWLDYNNEIENSFNKFSDKETPY